jgi:tyrosyl-tRNA synthetase
MADFLAELRWRGRIHQVTDEPGLAAHLASGKRRAYVGYDPTSNSLTIGNMVTIMLLAHFQRCGHTPVVFAGGGTGLIGDPSGKSAERQLMTAELVEANVQSQMRIFGRLLDFSPGLANRALIVNNADWLGKLLYLDALRDIGKHFSVNQMIQKDSVRERLHNRDQGISYTEFSYMVLQAYDYLHLLEHEGVTLQMGGSDQWGNIVLGLDLIRRKSLEDLDRMLKETRKPTGFSMAVTGGNEPEATYGLTTPLITKADGEKFGKTDSGAVWMTADRTSPYAFYQFWLNSDDSQVMNYLKAFTFLTQDRVAELEAAHARDPGAREAHRALARETTTLLHGKTEADLAERAARALFSGEIADLPEATLNEVLASAPSTDHDRAALGAGLPLLDLLPQTSLAKSKSEAREFLSSGSVSVNGAKAAADRKLTAGDLLHGRLIALRRGKKNWHLTRWK